MLGQTERGAEAVRHLPFPDGPFRLAMGLKSLAEADWFEIDGELRAHLEEKRHLFETRRDAVFAALTAADAPSAELRALVLEHLPRHHPDRYRRTGAGIDNLATGERWSAGELHPLDLCGRLVQEDFCILAPEDGRYVLAAATLCAPSRWRLKEKLGRPLAALHDPVPGYGSALAQPVERYFAQMKPGRLVGRVNWGLGTHPARFQPVALPGALPVTPETAGARLWLRIERQTLRKLPESGAVVFTIRTHIARLDRALEGRHAAAAALAEKIRTMPIEMQRYKEIDGFAPALLAWLSRRITA